MSDSLPPDDRLLEPDEIDELRGAIGALRRELDRRVGKRNDEPPVLERLSSELARTGRAVRDRMQEFDPVAAFEGIRGGGWPFGARSHSPDIDDFGLDRAALERAQPWLDFLYSRWWRVEAGGFENVPDGGRVIFVANRSGILPYDGLMISHALATELGEEHRPRFLLADWLVGLPFVQPLVARLGGVRACAENVERLLRSGRRVIAFPEGQKGAIKLFHDRYRLQRFARGGFVSIAVRERATIVPVGVVGAEEVHPILYQSPFLSRLLGVPAVLTPTFPHLGPVGAVPLPSRWRIRFGEPFSFEDVDPGRADDPLYVNRTTEQIRSATQSLLDAEVRSRPSAF